MQSKNSNEKIKFDPKTTSYRVNEPKIIQAYVLGVDFNYIITRPGTTSVPRNRLLFTMNLHNFPGKEHEERMKCVNLDLISTASSTLEIYRVRNVSLLWNFMALSAIYAHFMFLHNITFLFHVTLHDILISSPHSHYHLIVILGEKTVLTLISCESICNKV